jgi:hypothetical protein
VVILAHHLPSRHPFFPVRRAAEAIITTFRSFCISLAKAQTVVYKVSEYRVFAKEKMWMLH